MTSYFARDGEQDEVIIRTLITSLQDSLRNLEESSAKLSFYTWQDKESSLLYHLEMTMSMLKGEIFALKLESMAETIKVIEAVSKSGKLNMRNRIITELNACGYN